MERKRTKNQMVWPIFHYVENSDVCEKQKVMGKTWLHMKRSLETTLGRYTNGGLLCLKLPTWKDTISEKTRTYQYEFIERVADLAIAIENHSYIRSPSTNDSYNKQCWFRLP